MEVIWGNRLKPGEYKYIGGFPHFVADAGEERAGRWLDEKIDLARVYAEIWKDAAPAHLVDVAVFCDSDDTHTASVERIDRLPVLLIVTFRPEFQPPWTGQENRILGKQAGNPAGIVLVVAQRRLARF
jgi:hypothetical protein